MKKIDARGLECPQPVLKTKSTLQEDKPENIKVLIDNSASQQNVQRFLESQGYQTASGLEGTCYFVIGSYDFAPAAPLLPAKDRSTDAEKILVMCTSDRIGYGDDMLGLKLMINFLRTLKEMGDELWRLVFVNNGVKLTIQGSEVLEDLKAYETAGLNILVCGTCLDHFNLLKKKQTGQTTNMLDIVTAMQLADKVITI
ncbi:MAG: sulfurtransferase-like selenium metabolism protein YedF [Desulfobacteraceae bacterium]|nr:sulfurtransferase-like selenium metabolism protein YedF [Desulfobacteraceae bacterium]